MTKICLISFALLLCLSTMTYAQVDSVLVCDVHYKNAKYDNPHAGSGFLLKYKTKVYGITAKHVLFFAKSDSMKAIHFNNELASWTFQSKTDERNSVLAGKLINENIKEALVMPPKGDWLIFEIKAQIPPNIVIYTLREKPLKENEELHFLGYPYGNTTPIRVEGFFTGFTADKNLSMDVPQGKYGGCSGGPVIDKDGKVVGLVSMGYFNEKANKMIFEPASLDYFKTVMSQLEDTQNKR